MKYSIIMASLCAVFTTFSSPVRAERAWQGHILLVDSKIVMVFNGYDYGTWDDVGRLDFPALGRGSGGASGWTVGFQIAPDEDNSLLATISGKVELVVDGKKAVVKELRFVRAHKYANWRIDPEIIKALKKLPMRKNEGASQTDPDEKPKPTIKPLGDSCSSGPFSIRQQPPKT